MKGAVGRAFAMVLGNINVELGSRTLKVNFTDTGSTKREVHPAKYLRQERLLLGPLQSLPPPGLQLGPRGVHPSNQPVSHSGCGCNASLRS